jgi:hypothetical protein
MLMTIIAVPGIRAARASKMLLKALSIFKRTVSIISRCRFTANAAPGVSGILIYSKPD